MANFARKFFSSTGYTGGYTSDTIKGNEYDSSNEPRGVLQIVVTAGSAELQMRLVDEAPWVTIKSYTVDTVEEIVIAPQMRVVATDSAEVWVAETV